VGCSSVGGARQHGVLARVMHGVLSRSVDGTRTRAVGKTTAEVSDATRPDTPGTVIDPGRVRQQAGRHEREDR